MLRLDEQPVPPPETLAFWRGAGMAPEHPRRARGGRPFNYADVVAPMPLGFTRLVEGAEVVLGGRRWRVAFGQGHAPDHAVLWGGRARSGADRRPGAAGDHAEPRGLRDRAGGRSGGRVARRLRRLQATSRGRGSSRCRGTSGRFSGWGRGSRRWLAAQEAMLGRLADWLAEPRTAAGAFRRSTGGRSGRGSTGSRWSRRWGTSTICARRGRRCGRRGRRGSGYGGGREAVCARGPRSVTGGGWIGAIQPLAPGVRSTTSARPPPSRRGRACGTTAGASHPPAAGPCSCLL
jgi:hypothetical protein